MWLSPELGKQIPRSDYGNLLQQPVEDQNTNCSMSEQRMNPLPHSIETPKTNGHFAAQVLYQDIDTRARSPWRAESFPASSGTSGSVSAIDTSSRTPGPVA